MKKLTGILMIGLLAFGLVGVGLAGDTDPHNLQIKIPELKWLDIVEEFDGSTDVLLEIAEVDGAGKAYFTSNPQNSSLYLRYTVLTASPKQITALLGGTDEVPEYVDLCVVATAPTGGKGTKGAPAAELTLDDKIAYPLITGIGSCWTGIGTTDGANLTYTLKLEGAHEAHELATETVDLTVTYTISD